jgi:hypothetical protein
MHIRYAFVRRTHDALSPLPLVAGVRDVAGTRSDAASGAQRKVMKNSVRKLWGFPASQVPVAAAYSRGV